MVMVKSVAEDVSDVMIYRAVWMQLSVPQFIAGHFKVDTFSRANIQLGIRYFRDFNVM